MALAGVLSAIKELVLDAPLLPNSQEERETLYKEKFLTLSSEEIEDLAKIKPEQLGTYTMTIFNGEKSGLNNHFLMTLALLKRHWSKLSDKPYNEFELVKELHKVKPWKSSKFRDLAENFKIYLLEDEDKFRKEIPELFDTVIFETTVMDTRRHLNTDGLEAKDSLTLAEISEMTVPELLGLSYQIPAYNHFLNFSHDMVATKNHFKKGKELPEEIIKTNQFAICSRNIRMISRWTAVPELLWLNLKDQERNTKKELAELADIADELFPDAENEEVLFAKFMEQIAALVNHGALILTN